MPEKTKIEWADHSWSPWRGCTKVSPGCANCYAETLSKRNPAVLGQWGKGAPRVLAKNWGDPVKWNQYKTCDCGAIRCHVHDLQAMCPICRSGYRRPRVFPSLCDWLDDEVPIEWLAQFLATIHATPNLDWLLLTKRPENWTRVRDAASKGNLLMPAAKWIYHWFHGEAPDNVWFGVSVEDQERADKRIPLLRYIPAKLRWLSVEPLIGPVDLRLVYQMSGFPNHITKEGYARGHNFPIHWAVIGGESGPGARPCSVDWVRSAAAQCKVVDVPVFVKQIGAYPVADERELWMQAGKPEDWQPRAGLVPMKIRHPKGGDPLEWPKDLVVRQYPNR